MQRGAALGISAGPTAGRRAQGDRPLRRQLPAAAIVFNRINDDSDLAATVADLRKVVPPSIGVYLGLRRDCGSTLTRVSRTAGRFVRRPPGLRLCRADQRFPQPRCGEGQRQLPGGRPRDRRPQRIHRRPRHAPALIRSVEFEGPYYAEWPPATHRNIFIESPHEGDAAAYARDIIGSFATRAFRRPGHRS